MGCSPKDFIKKKKKKNAAIPAVVLLQAVKVRVLAVRIVTIIENKVGIPVETVLPVFRRADGASVRLSVFHITVSGSY